MQPETSSSSFDIAHSSDLDLGPQVATQKDYNELFDKTAGRQRPRRSARYSSEDSDDTEPYATRCSGLTSRAAAARKPPALKILVQRALCWLKRLCQPPLPRLCPRCRVQRSGRLRT